MKKLIFVCAIFFGFNNISFAKILTDQMKSNLSGYVISSFSQFGASARNCHKPFLEEYNSALETILSNTSFSRNQISKLLVDGMAHELALIGDDCNLDAVKTFKDGFDLSLKQFEYEKNVVD